MEHLQFMITCESNQELATYLLFWQGCKMINSGKDQCDNVKEFCNEKSKKI